MQSGHKFYKPYKRMIELKFDLEEDDIKVAATWFVLIPTSVDDILDLSDYLRMNNSVT